MGPLPDKAGHRSGPKPIEPTENTPLLAPLVPRIEEECDAEDAREPPNFLTMLKEEAGVLTKYTLPVFAYVILAIVRSSVLTLFTLKDASI